MGFDSGLWSNCLHNVLLLGFCNDSILDRLFGLDLENENIFCILRIGFGTIDKGKIFFMLNPLSSTLRVALLDCDLRGTENKKSSYYR